MALPFVLASTFRLSIWMLLRRFRRCHPVFRWLSMAHPCHLLKVGHQDPYGQAWSVFSNVNQFVIHIDSVNAQINEPSISLNYSQAIVWQIKYIVSIFLSKKAAVSATAELQYVSQTPHKSWSDTDFLSVNRYSCQRNSAQILTSTTSRSSLSRLTWKTLTEQPEIRMKASSPLFYLRCSPACAESQSSSNISTR